ncbi:MAG: hypothetical protein IPJ40_10055 [Saprospirales bacterium]|nr:hypothetical protein [Saprospirales bacterium]
MRNLILTLLLLCAYSLMHAQVQEGKAPMSRGMQSAFYVKLENTRAKDVENLWTKYARSLNGKTDDVRRTDEYLTDDATIKGMSENTVDVYALAQEQGSDVVFYLWFDLGGAFLDSRVHGTKADIGKQIAVEFAQTVRADQLETAIKDQGDVLKKLEKDLADFEKDQKESEKDIADYEKKIEEARETIKEAVRNQETKKRRSKRDKENSENWSSL